MNGIFITGTDTNAGKTWFAVKLIQYLVMQDVHVTPRKPAESGWNPDIVKTDAWQLANAANKINKLDEICPFRFNRAVSPARAAREEGIPLSIAQLAQGCTHRLTPSEFLVVEGAGGFYSPIASDGLNADLARALNLPVLLVAENRLGTINQVLLTADAIESRGLELSGIILNIRESASEEETLFHDNFHDISSLLKTDVYCLGFNEDNSNEIGKLARRLIPIPEPD